MNNDSHYAELEWDAEGQPRSTLFGDIFFSKDNGLAESRHVFLAQNHLPERWQALSDHTSTTPSPVAASAKIQSSFVIAETGFGSGLNFLNAWQLWESCPTTNCVLHFISVEKYPMRKTDLANTLALWPELALYAEQLLAIYPDIANPGFRRLILTPNVYLTLIIDDAARGLAELLASEHPAHRHANFSNADLGAGVDAWFLDGFAPSKNPDMWTDKLFSIIAELSHPGTTLATFTSAGVVKRGLRDAGFQIEKTPGFGQKRESLRAVFGAEKSGDINPDSKKKTEEFITSSYSSIHPVPWSVTPTNRKNSGNDITIVGAGLAGCHTARALANRGWHVTVIDKQTTAGMGASGNPQGIVYGKLSKDTDGLAQFNLAALLFAQQIYRDYWHLPGLGKKCGVLQLCTDENSTLLYQQLQTTFGAQSNFLQFLPPEKTNEIAGIAVNCPSLAFPELGWLNPAALCRQLLDHPRIRFIGDTVVTHLVFSNEGSSVDNGYATPQWHLYHHDQHHQKEIQRTPKVIIATAHHASQFTQTTHLPLKAIRGQISIAQTPLVKNLRSVICGEGYLAPSNESGLQTLGATFTLSNSADEVSDIDHQTNIDQVSTLSPELAARLTSINTSDLTGRVGFRCSTPDYLPVVGPAPLLENYLRDFSLLRKNANATIATAGSYWPGLYLNVGHGSRGLAYTPLCAELLAAQISATPWPVGRSLATALHPARFIIRDLIRNRR